VVTRPVATRWNGLDPVPKVVRGVQTDFLEKMSATSFDPSFLHQTTSSEGHARGFVLGNLVNYLVDELLREVRTWWGRSSGQISAEAEWQSRDPVEANPKRGNIVVSGVGLGQNNLQSASATTP
jgi:hypothetical protein